MVGGRNLVNKAVLDCAVFFCRKPSLGCSVLMTSNRDFADIEMLVEVVSFREGIPQLFLQVHLTKPNKFVPRLTLFAQGYFGKQNIIFQI